MFLGSFAILLALCQTGVLYMHSYALVFAVLFAVAIIIPMGYTYAVTGYRINVGYWNVQYIRCSLCVVRRLLMSLAL